MRGIKMVAAGLLLVLLLVFLLVGTGRDVSHVHEDYQRWADVDIPGWDQKDRPLGSSDHPYVTVMYDAPDPEGRNGPANVWVEVKGCGVGYCGPLTMEALEKELPMVMDGQGTGELRSEMTLLNPLRWHGDPRSIPEAQLGLDTVGGHRVATTTSEHLNMSGVGLLGNGGKNAIYVTADATGWSIDALMVVARTAFNAFSDAISP